MPNDGARVVQMTVSSYRGRLAAAGLVGLLVGGGTYFLWDKIRTVADDEDRPPIIVKNGSVEFENGRDFAGGGKAWRKVNTSSEEWWRMDQPNGHWPGFFAVSFKDASCASVYTPHVEVHYTGGVAPFVITKRPRNPNMPSDKKLEPVVVGMGLQEKTDALYPTVWLEGTTLKISKVVMKTGPNSSQECTAPTEVRVEIVR